MGALNGVLVACARLADHRGDAGDDGHWQEALRLWQQGGLHQSARRRAMVRPEPDRGTSRRDAALRLACSSPLALAMKNLAAGRFVYAVGSRRRSRASRRASARSARPSASSCSWARLTGLAAVLNVVQSPQVRAEGGRRPRAESHRRGGRRRRRDHRRTRAALGRARRACCCSANVEPALTHFARARRIGKRRSRAAIILLAVVADGLTQSQRRRNRMTTRKPGMQITARSATRRSCCWCC